MYVLGIDIGTTFTAAAVLRDGQTEICRLGSRSAAIPSVVLLREDGTVLVGDAADRRALSEPERVAREFKRRIGDTTPIMLGGTPRSAEELTAALLRSVVADVVARQGGEPTAACVTHPANWGPFKTDLLRRAVELADLRFPVRFVSEPEAAAVAYSQEQRVAVGGTIAVYDLGGGTFDAAVLRRTQDGFGILGEPEGIERLGGMDIDAAVFDHVARTLGPDATDLDEDDPAAVAAMARLRRECTEAKEALSSDTDTAIPVLLPNLSTTVRLTRGELEAMVGPALHTSIGALRRALRSAAVMPADLTSVLLVGGSSRIPLVAQLISADLARPVAVDAEPKHVVALGAAWLASELIDSAVPAMPVAAAAGTALRTRPALVAPTAPAGPRPAPTDTTPTDTAPTEPAPTDTAPTEPAPTEPAPVRWEALAAIPVQAGRGSPPRSRSGRRIGLVAAALALGLVSAGGMTMLRQAPGKTVAVADLTSPAPTGPAPTGQTGPTGPSSTGQALAGGSGGVVPGTTAPLVRTTNVAPSPAAARTGPSQAPAAPAATAATVTATPATTTRPRSTSSAPATSPAARSVAAVPAMVEGLTVSRGKATGSTATSVLVTWIAEADATSFLVEWRITGSGDAGRSRVTTSGQVTLGGLLPGTRYTVRVTPVNAQGRGPSTTATGSTAQR